MFTESKSLSKLIAVKQLTLMPFAVVGTGPVQRADHRHEIADRAGVYLLSLLTPLVGIPVFFPGRYCHR